MRVVFDTVIFVRSLINPFGLMGHIVFDRAADYQLVASSLVTMEIMRVIVRPELTRKYRAAAGRDSRRVASLLANAELVHVSEIPSVSRDPTDDKFLATAKEARADYLVSEDHDLLVLGEYDGTRIVNAAAFLAILRQEQPDNDLRARAGG